MIASVMEPRKTVGLSYFPVQELPDNVCDVFEHWGLNNEVDLHIAPLKSRASTGRRVGTFLSAGKRASALG
jgi:hypothetical protein